MRKKLQKQLQKKEYHNAMSTTKSGLGKKKKKNPGRKGK